MWPMLPAKNLQPGMILKQRGLVELPLITEEDVDRVVINQAKQAQRQNDESGRDCEMVELG